MTATTPLQQQQMLRTQASIEDHALAGQRRVSDHSTQSNTSPTGNAPRVKPRPSPLFGTEEVSTTSPTTHSYQQHVPAPLQAVPTYNSAGNNSVNVTPAMPQQQEQHQEGGLLMPRDISHSTMEFSEVSPQHNRVSENEPSRNADHSDFFA